MSHRRQQPQTDEYWLTEPAASGWLHALVGWTFHFVSILKTTSASSPAAMSVKRIRLERGIRISRRWKGGRPKSTCSGNQPASDGNHHRFHLSERIRVPGDNSPESNVALSWSALNGPDSIPSFLLIVNCVAIFKANEEHQRPGANKRSAWKHNVIAGLAACNC